MKKWVTSRKIFNYLVKTVILAWMPGSSAMDGNCLNRACFLEPPGGLNFHIPVTGSRLPCRDGESWVSRRLLSTTMSASAGTIKLVLEKMSYIKEDF